MPVARSTQGMRAVTWWGWAALALAVGALVLAAPAQATFPGSNGRIFFVSDRDGQQPLPEYELYSMRPDGSDVVRLTDTPGSEYGPSVSADGRWVVYAYLPSVSEPNTGQARIEMRSWLGERRTELTQSQPGRDDWDPAFSPDSETVAFSRETAGDGTGELWTVATDGSGSPQSIDPVGSNFVYEPSYYPDGTRIAFQGRMFGGATTRIFSIVSTGLGGVEADSPASPRSSYFPSVSPSSDRVAFSRSELIGGDSYSGIFTSTVAEGDLQTVLAPTVPYDSYGATYSPDGEQMTLARFSSADPERYSQVVRVPLAGGSPVPLTSGAFNSDYPDWGPMVGLPRVRISKKPAKKSKARRATFRVRASISSAAVECWVDNRPIKLCRPGRKTSFRRLKPGRHVFRARGVADGATTPALFYTDVGPTRVYRWKVRR